MESDKALDMALSQIEKQFGEGAVMKMGEKTTMQIESVPTGALALDLALGGGGLPRGGIKQIYGPANKKINFIHRFYPTLQSSKDVHECRKLQC